jgi:hypothetical protein
MAFAVAGIKIEITADASKAAAALGRAGDAAGKSADAAEKSTSKWKTFARTAAVAAGSAALGGLVAMFKTGVQEQSDYLAGQAQLQAGIKSTGNAAHVSVKGLEDLATSIQGYSGQTDDSIVASEKLLLTFTNVRNEAGKNNDIFSQATKITADMAARMGGDASKYAVQLGKALNDPVKGLSALTRIGVTFTDAQKKSIKTMQESGDTLGAQKIIMGELRKEFGGSAKAAGQTLPGQMARAKRSFEDVSQQLVASFMPVLTELADVLLRDVMPAFKTVMGFILQHKTVFGIVAGAVGGLVIAFKAFGMISGAIKGTIAAVKMIGPAIKGIGLAMNFLAANPIILIIVAIVALGIALVILYKKSATFRKIVQAAFKAVLTAGKALWTGLKAAFNGIVTAAKAVWSALKTGFGVLVSAVKVAAKILYYWYVWPWKTAYTVIVGAVRAIITWLPGAWRAIVTGIKTGLSAVSRVITAPFRAAWNWIHNSLIPAIKNAWGGIAGAIRRGLSAVSSTITAPFRAAWNWIKNSLIPAIKGAWGGIASGIRRGLSAVASAIIGPFRSAWDWIKQYVAAPIRNMFSGLAGAIGHAMRGVFTAITGPFKSAWDWISRWVVDPIKSVWNGIADAINAIHFSIKIPKGIPFIGGKGWTFDPPHVPRLASGGVFDAATLAVVGEAGREIVAPDDLLRRLIREEMGNAGTTIIVNGALDPDAVARQIDRLLTGRARRTSGVQRSGTRTVASA